MLQELLLLSYIMVSSLLYELPLLPYVQLYESLLNNPYNCVLLATVSTLLHPDAKLIWFLFIHDVVCCWKFVNHKKEGKRGNIIIFVVLIELILCLFEERKNDC